MKIAIVIPAHNEEAFLGKTLQSLVEQTLLPQNLIIVNDHSTDSTQSIIDRFSEKNSFIHSVLITSEETHAPGSKVIQAFYKGYETLKKAFQIRCFFSFLALMQIYV